MSKQDANQNTLDDQDEQIFEERKFLTRFLTEAQGEYIKHENDQGTQIPVEDLRLVLGDLKQEYINQNTASEEAIVGLANSIEPYLDKLSRNMHKDIQSLARGLQKAYDSDKKEIITITTGSKEKGDLRSQDIFMWKDQQIPADVTKEMLPIYAAPVSPITKTVAILNNDPKTVAIPTSELCKHGMQILQSERQKIKKNFRTKVCKLAERVTSKMPSLDKHFSRNSASPYSDNTPPRKKSLS